MRTYLVVFIMLVACSDALAHAGEHHHDTHWLAQWNWDPIILFNLILLSWLYLRGVQRMWTSAGAGHGVSRGQVFAFASSMVAVFVALVSPLDPLSDVLQSAHMIQHMTLMMIAAPLFVIAVPWVVMLWALPQTWRQTVAQWQQKIQTWNPPWYLLWQPLLMWVLYALVLWIWHLPALYEAALRSRMIHEIQHLTFFIASCLFWRVLLDPIGRLRLSRGVGVIYLFTTSLHATVLGVFMALAPRPWYADYIGRTDVWNLTAMEDQQLAGFIMWMPACMVYAIVAAAIFALWIREPEDSVATGGA